MAAELTESVCARAEKHRAVAWAGLSKPPQIRALFRIDGCTNRETLRHPSKATRNEFSLAKVHCRNQF